MNPLRTSLLLLLTLGLAGCTTVGVHLPGGAEAREFGPEIDLRVCVLLDPELPESRPRTLMKAIQSEFEPYGIRVRLESVEPWERPGFFRDAIIQDLLRRPLPRNCDRLLGMVGRNVGDTLWSLALPEVLGAVESTRAVRGYVVAEVGSIPQLLWSPPSATAVHEFYHFLGCRHALTKAACYVQIRELKAAYARGADFFPGVAADGSPIVSRDGGPVYR